MSKTTREVPASIFTTKHDDELTFPFFETEDGTIIGSGHRDKTEFATAVTLYDEMTSGMGYVTSPESVEWKYAKVKLRKTPDEPAGEWWFTWSKNGVDVTSTTKGAIAITVVIR